jgi:two-component system, OmpR family, sensor histidine kinase CreC
LKIRTRVFLGILIIAGIGFSFFVWWLAGALEPEFRKIAEEPLVDTSRVLASLAAASTRRGKIDVKMFRNAFEDVYGRTFSAKIYDYEKTAVDYRVYITDASGKVLFDSLGADEGRSFGRWIDVSRTLRGKYGARSSRDDPADPGTGVLYVASPIIVRGEIVGVLSVGKPVRATSQFVKDTKRKIVIGGTLVCLLVVLVGLVMSGTVTRPIRKLTVYAKSVRDGKRTVMPELGKSEIGELGRTFEEMRDALEGKRYVEKYVQTLTHEIKSPLAAIQGGVELLKEGMPPDAQARFLANLQSETGRINAIVEKLLLLSSLEIRKGVREVERLDMKEIVAGIARNLQPLLAVKGIHVDVAGGNPAFFDGERFLVDHAVENLFRNAIEFSPREGRISVAVSQTAGGAVELTIRDQGPGIPGYALERVFDRFYSLKRPDTGKKSSGLGLTLAKEVAVLHGGAISLENAPGGGAVAVLTLPEAGTTRDAQG